MKSYWSRIEHEKLLVRLSEEAKMDVPKSINKTSDYGLLTLINHRLVKLDCIPMDVEELERDLK